MTNGKLTNVTSEVGLESHKGWWRGVAVGDLDDDGDVDYVVTNQGKNTKYHADAKHPHRIYYNDFDNNGIMDLVEAEYEGDTEFPVRGRSCSSCTMPFIAEKFETYHEFAMASLTDIYETDIKEGPHHEVTSLESCILWNDGGKFSVEPLPRFAQISPAFGVAIADLDSDAKLDIFMANNFFGSQPETGYMDGGMSWFLKGDGKGEFDAIWPNKSGVVLNKDSNGVALADFDHDGQLDVLVGVTNGTTKLLTPNSKDESNSKRLVITGPAENRNSIGARLTLVGDSKQRVIELNGGDSHMSQSDLTVYPVSEKTLADFTKATVVWTDGKSTEKELKADGETIELIYPGE